MQALMVVMMSVSAALQVWVEAPDAHVYPDGVPGKAALREARIHAACGERESFQVCVRAKRKNPGEISLQAAALNGGIGAPEIRNVGYTDISEVKEGTVHSPALIPDPLLDYAPVEVPVDETRVFWVTYTVPRDAKPGLHRGQIVIEPEKGQKKRVKVTLSVFDFALPETPSLRSLFPLDRKSINRVYGLTDTDLDAWKPIYDALARPLISYSVWDGGELVSLNKSDGPGMDALHEHLAYAAESARMNTIDIGPGTSGISAFPGKTSVDNQALKQYLNGINDWLAERDWLSRAVFEPCAFPIRDEWNGARRQMFHLKEADSRVVRLLCGPLHPFFEEYSEICAVPPRLFDVHADRRAFDGFSLIDAPNFLAGTVTGTSSLPSSLPEDACDGCVFTSWISGDAPTPEKPQWLEISLRQPVKTRHLKVVWKSGSEAVDFAVHVLKQHGYVQLRDAEWRPYPATVPQGQSWAEAHLKNEVTFTGIRFVFRQSISGGPVGVTEVLLNEPPKDPPKKIEPLEPWVLLEQGNFPDLMIGAHPAQARMAPWLCYHQTAAGFVCRVLSAWPESWSSAAKTPPQVWPDASRGAGYLFYPGTSGPIPSIRAELLREGMEDYEYLVALESVVAKNKVRDRQLVQFAQRVPYPAYMPPELADRVMADMKKMRKKIGWTLGEIARKGVQ